VLAVVGRFVTDFADMVAGRNPIGRHGDRSQRGTHPAEDLSSIDRRHNPGPAHRSAWRYCIDDERRTVWLTDAAPGHPEATE